MLTCTDCVRAEWFRHPVDPPGGPIVEYSTNVGIRLYIRNWLVHEKLTTVLGARTFHKFESPTSNISVTVDLSIGTVNGKTVLSITSSGNGKTTQFKLSRDDQNLEKPVLCGDSAWWFLSDSYSPGERILRPHPLARFSPVLAGNYGLRTTDDRWFMTDLPLSGMVRFWNMVRDIGGRTEVLCNVRGFVDSGMTLFHSPRTWGF